LLYSQRYPFQLADENEEEEDEKEEDEDDEEKDTFENGTPPRGRRGTMEHTQQ